MKITQKLMVTLKSMLSLKMGEVKTDKATLIWDDKDGDLKAGDEVFVEVDEEIRPAEDGEYITEDGKTIVVVEGKVAEIRDAEAEVAPEAEVEAEAVEAAEEAAEPEAEPIDEPEVEETASEEDRIAALESRVGALVDALNEMTTVIGNLEGRIGELEGKLASVEAPAADPVEEVTVEASEQKKSRLDYLRK